MVNRKNKIIFTGILLIIILFVLNPISAISVNADYIKIYPGESGKVTVKIDNNENFDTENVFMSLNLDDKDFTTIGNSQKDFDDINEDDDDSTFFTIRASTDMVPGDYNIPYTIKYTNAENKSETFTKKGSFGIRVSAKTDLDFSAETNQNAIMGSSGQITLEIINRGLGEIKSVSVEIFPQRYELLSNNKIFIGTINGGDSDTASFDVVYTSTSPVVSAKITYKDFDNNNQIQTINLPLKVYTKNQATNLGLIKKQSYTAYILIGLIILALVIWWRIKKRRKRKRGK